MNKYLASRESLKHEIARKRNLARVGEVKGGGITHRNFVELAEIAEVLRPQRAIIFLPHENISPDVLKWTNETQNRLAPKGIKAQMFALPTF